MMATPSHPLPGSTTQDREHLRLLSVFHYIVAAITALFSLLPIIHLVIGVGMVTGKIETHDSGAAMAGWFFVVFAVCFIMAGLTLAGFIAYAGRCLAQQRHYTLCLVAAALACMMMPVGTVLGVFTLIVLLRPTVKPLFAA